MNINCIFTFLLLKISLILSANGARTKDHMYEYFNPTSTCFRRLNATHQVGCTSKRHGSAGPLHFVENTADIDYLLKKGNAGEYVPIIPTSLFDPQLLHRLKQSNIIAGLVLYHNENTTLASFSHEETCPNRQSNIKGTCDNNWNRYGTGIAHQDIPFPIYYMHKSSDVHKMRECFQKYNNFSFETQYTRSLCSLEIDTFMYAATNTPTCIRRSNLKTNLNPETYCEPLNGETIWSSLFPLENRMKHIILAARMDTTSLFGQHYPGAISPITSLVNLLATAELLKRMVVNDDGKSGIVHDKNVLFVLFGGESFDYIGSERFVYDMQLDRFPMPYDSKYNVPVIRLDDITLYLELHQLSKSDALYVHLNENTPEAANFLAKFKTYSKFATIKEYGINLLPSSLQSFVKLKSNMSGIVIADHGDVYANKFFNSVFDDADNIGYQYINVTEEDAETNIPIDSIQYYVANISEAVAKSLFEEVMNKKYVGAEKPRLQFIDELFNCYLNDADCKIHKAIQRKTKEDIPRSSYTFYTGVSGLPNLLTYAIGLTLGWVTGDIVSTNGTCGNNFKSPLYQYLNMSRSIDNQTLVCFRTTLNFTEGLSPAFLIEDYDWNSGRYSSWSESAWRDFTVRMFLKPSAAHERFTIAIGSVTFIMSLIFVYFVKIKSNVLFVTPRPCSPTVC